MQRSTARSAFYTVLIAAFIAAAPGCSSTGSGFAPLGLSAKAKAATGAKGVATLLRTPEGVSVSLSEAVDSLAGADVVFLGELHDNALGHAVQLSLTKALAERRGRIILSMEMLERDMQPTLDLYLRGALSESEFKGLAQLWPNYDEHYRGAVEFCKTSGFQVVAANVYRPIASSIAKHGIAAGAGDPWAARSITAPRSGEYRRRFNEIMGEHGSTMDAASLDNVFAAQCVKDDTMAESIAEALDAFPEAGTAPQVVHWNGRFHSDHGLGTVERLKARRPHLKLAVVSMLGRKLTALEPLTGDELSQGQFLILAE